MAIASRLHRTPDELARTLTVDAFHELIAWYEIVEPETRAKR